MTQTGSQDISAGDLVTVHGKLSVYRDVKEIWMTLISKEVNYHPHALPTKNIDPFRITYLIWNGPKILPYLE